MSFILALLIILLAWFFLIAPFLRLVKISRQWRNAFNQADPRRYRQPRQQQQPRPARKKKIDPGVGEYVEFTETTSTTTQTETDGSTRTTSETEQQITDVSWEDLP